MPTTKQIYNAPMLFEVRLNLLPDNRGILTAEDVKGAIHVSTPPEFGGPEDNWSPEHLFLCALCSCFMTTYQYFSKAFSLQDMQCDGIGQISLRDGKFQFAKVDLHARIYVARDSEIQQAEAAFQKAKKYCIIGNTVKCDLAYHKQIFRYHEFGKQYPVK